MAVLPTVCGVNQQTFGAILVLTLEIIFLALFGIFVRYGNDALPPDNPEKLEHVTPINYSMFMDTHVMIFIGFGYLMTFLKKYSFGAVGFTFLFGAVLVQWAILSNGFYDFDDNYKISLNLEGLLHADIAAAAPLISMGALLGRTTYVQLIVMGIIELAIYSANNYLAAQLWKVSDAGASIFVHTFGAYFGLAVSWVLNRKKGDDNENEFGSTYTSDTFAMIGTVFLWIFWPSFNAAEVTGDSQHRAIINTYLSLAACCVTSFILSYLFSPEKKFDMVHIQNSTLAGGVAVGATADLMVQPWGAMLIGICAAFISVFGYSILSPFLAKKFHIQDTCGVHNLHGMPGFMAGLISVIMAAIASMDLYNYTLFVHYPAMALSKNSINETIDILGIHGDGRTAGQQAGYQMAALVVTFVIAIVGGLITGVIINCKLLNLGDDVEKNKDENFWKIEEGHDEKHATP